MIDAYGLAAAHLLHPEPQRRAIPDADLTFGTGLSEWIVRLLRRRADLGRRLRESRVRCPLRGYPSPKPLRGFGPAEGEGWPVSCRAREEIFSPVSGFHDHRDQSEVNSD